MRRRSTVRALIGAWLAVAAIVGLSWFFKPDAESARGQVDARYEVQPRRAAPRVVVDAPEQGVTEGAAEVAALTSEQEAEVSAIESWQWTPPVGTGRLFGTVTVRETGAPLAGVLVGASSTDSYDYSVGVGAAVSGADGTYELTALPAGTLEVHARSGEVEEVTQDGSCTVHLRAGEERQADLVVSRAGRVWGTVTDLGGTPVRHAKILVGTTESIVSQVASAATSRRRPLLAQTNEQGAYVVQGVPFEQEWQVWIDHDDHSPVLSPSFVLHATRPHVRMDVTLLRGTRITGRVVEPSGRTVAGAKVACIPRYSALLTPMRRAQTVREATSEDDGTFLIEGLPTGDYQLLGFKDGYRIAFKGTPVYPDGRNDITDVQVVLRPVTEGDHVVFGEVVDAAGAPIVGARVGLAAAGLDSLSFGGKETTTGADGAFRFEGVGDGLFLLVAQAKGHRRRLTEDVPLDRSLTIELEREATLSGVVLLPGGTPAQAFSVRLVRSSSASLLASLEQASSARWFEDAQGRFDLTDVPPGRVVLEAAAPGFAPGRTEVDVPGGRSTSGVTIRLPAVGATIRGRVTTAGGAPVAGAKVTVNELGPASGLLALADERRARPVVTSDARGAFTLEGLATATYVLSATHPDHAPATVRSVVARSGETVDVLAVMTGGGTILGQAPPGVMITIAGDGFSAMVATGESGSYRVDRLRAGEYLVRALVSDERDLTSTPEVHRRSVRVVDGRETRVEFLEEAPQGRTVTGRVDPPPAQGALVMVMLRVPGSPPPDPADLIFQGQLGVSDPETSRYVVAEGLVEADGSFALPGVPPGRYTQDVYRTSLLGTLAGDQATLQERTEITVD